MMKYYHEQNLNRIAQKSKNGRIMLLSKFAACNSKKLKFFKEKQARGLLSSWKGIKVPIPSDLPLINSLF